MVWDNGYTAYLARKGPGDSTNWERFNLLTKAMRGQQDQSYEVNKGLSGQGSKFWTSPKLFYTLVCLDRNLRPIFLDLKRSPVSNKK